MTDVYVRPGDANSTHDMSLAGGGEIFGFRMQEGIESLQSVPDQSSSIVASQEGKKFGDWEPKHAHIEQRDWSGGRGLANHSDDKSRFFDSQNANTTIPGKILPSYQWQIALGDHRDADQNLPGNVNWIALVGDNLYTSNQFTASASYDAEYIYTWIRRVGNPGTLTIALYSDNSGVPNAALQTKTCTTDDITDVISVWLESDISTESLTGSTVYHVVAYGDSSDNADNHWEIGVNKTTNLAKSSTNGSTWNSFPGFSLYYRVTDAGTSMKYWMFMLNQFDMHFISQPSTGDSEIFEWDETNDEIDAIAEGGDALSGIVQDIAISNDLVHCARGTGGSDETIWTYDHNTSAGQDDATGTNKADTLLAMNHKEDGPQIWRGENDNHVINRSAVKDFNTDLTFGDDIELPRKYDIVGMCEYNGSPYIRTRDNIYFVVNDKLEKLPTGIDRVIETADWVPMMSKDLFLYFAWSHSVERYYQGTMDDIGPWKDEGLPEIRRGPVVAMESGIGGFFEVVDAGANGYSSVLFNNTKGDHEIFRSPVMGHRIYNVFWQSVADARPRLWVSCGPDLYYMEYPLNAINPLQDSGVNYHHEWVVTSSTIDMEAASIPKAFRELVGWCENLISGVEVMVDYQVDEDVDTDNWLSVGGFLSAGEDEVAINEGNRRKIRYRLRGRTNDSDRPPYVEATVLEAFGRVPWKPQLVLNLKSGSYSVTWQGLPDHDPNDLLDFLIDASLNAVLFHMRAVWPHVDDKWVVIEPASILPEMVDRNTGNWQGGIRCTLSVEG